MSERFEKLAAKEPWVAVSVPRESFLVSWDPGMYLGKAHHDNVKWSPELSDAYQWLSKNEAEKVASSHMLVPLSHARKMHTIWEKFRKQRRERGEKLASVRGDHLTIEQLADDVISSGKLNAWDSGLDPLYEEGWEIAKTTMEMKAVDVAREHGIDANDLLAEVRRQLLEAGYRGKELTSV